MNWQFPRSIPNTASAEIFPLRYLLSLYNGQGNTNMYCDHGLIPHGTDSPDSSSFKIYLSYS